MINAGKVIDNTSFSNNTSENSIAKIQSPIKEESTHNIENTSDLADYNYAIIDDKLIEEQIKIRNSLIDSGDWTEIRGGTTDKSSYGSWEADFRKRMTPLKGQIVVTGYKGNKDDITIPSCVNDKKVVAIGVGAFFNNKLKKVNIPNSVVFLCSHSMPKTLESMEIPANVKIIDDYCFKSTSLKSITIPKTVEEVGYYAFDLGQLQSVTIESGSTKIGAGAFEYNHISTLNLPNDIKTIPDWTFANNSLETLKLPDSVTEIGESAFENSGLTSVSIGKKVSKIGVEAFTSNHLTEITIPNNVDEIGEYAFSDNNFTSVTMPKKFSDEKDTYFNDEEDSTDLSDVKFNLI
ncbi:hypothetical protein BFS06_14420 [Clostridium perfringens]|uniref:Leucine-rich cell surface protein n=1 Tax=Clostridium perfringens TaxID=1502 RepID=A0A140GRC5_CLOPF|nr:leucine-rich repeat domain-containing protein [Clostridium perfringens]AMN31084.1 leucine-rich cell surface protein [Clostridium perfringens]TBX14401.1 hypothetical protein BFS06_14420 [Clostridium perfringens]